MPAPTVTFTSRATRSHFPISRFKPSGVKRYDRSRSFYGDASAIARGHRTKPLREHFRQRARIGRRYPQSQQVALAIRLGKVFERSSIVKDSVVVYELYIARLKLHRQAELWIVRQFVEQIQSF